MPVVTGIARSGNSYLSRLLGALPGIFCAHEPMTDFMLSVSDRSDFGRVFYADRVEGFCVRPTFCQRRRPGPYFSPRHEDSVSGPQVLPTCCNCLIWSWWPCCAIR